MAWFQKNRTQLITIGVLIALFLLAIQSMSTEDWVVTTLRGLSTGAMIFLVAAGLSIIFGLMDVLNLAHGELFMVGAYVAWTMYVRPDTVVDGLTPFSIIAAGLILVPVWRDSPLRRLNLPPLATRLWPWVAVLLGGALIGYLVAHYPITSWSTENFAISPVSFSVALENGLEKIPEPVPFDTSPALSLGGLMIGSGLLSIGLAGLTARSNQNPQSRSQRQQNIILGIFLLILAFVVLAINTPLTEFLFGLNTTLRFLIAVVVATVTGMILGAIIEMLLIRPLYDRPIYQIMMTLGIGFIGLELVRTVWGRSEFSMPRPALFAGSGDACPAANLADLFAHHCSTYVLFDARVRVYNEFFLTLVGIVVLILVTLLLQRTRLGMIIRAGVEDSKMVEALGIDVQRIFTLVFALGAGLAALGGGLAGVALGLSNDMGIRVLLLALIALAIGGLTSYPGAAAGALLVGLLQQFIVKYGQIGIQLPFLAEPFKPSPPLVPASTILLMVVILLLLPQGLFGQKES